MFGRNQYKTIFFTWFVLFMGGISFFATQSHAQVGQASLRAFQSDGLLVKFSANVSQKNINRALNSAGCGNGKAVSRSLLKGLVQTKVQSGSMSRAIRKLRRNNLVQFVEPNYLLSAAIEPNDPQFNNLYGLNNTGQTGGTVDADIDGPEAWDVTTGTDTIVAVIDTGLDNTHVDIMGNDWRNTNEIAGNGIDDDGNGYVDDVFGWDFVNNDAFPLDDNGHGTHVSGTIAAVGNNGVGIAGVNWSARIMALKFMDATGVGSTANAVAAIDYAVANGARVINASFGGAGFSTAMFNAISAANNAGIVFVAAAGNRGANNDVIPQYPANYNVANIISVAATDDTDGLAGFSNFGSSTVHIGAPGVNILSTVPNNSYASFSGTSMASPHVAGVAALVFSYNPSLSAAEVISAILNGSDPTVSLGSLTITGGRLNAQLALASAPPPVGTPPPVPPPANLNILPANGSVIVGQSIQFIATGGATPYNWSVSDTLVASINANTGLLVGQTAGTILVTAMDANGITGTSGIITVNDAAPPPVPPTPPAPIVNVSPLTGSVAVNGTLQFSATGSTATPFTWSVSNPAIAGISATGLLTGIAAGAVTVTATDTNLLAGNSGNITVTAAPAPGPGPGMGGGMGGRRGGGGGMAPLSVSPTSLIVNSRKRGTSVQFTAAGGTPPLTFSITNNNIGNIDPSTGLLTLRRKSKGVTTVIVTDANGVTVTTAEITVTKNK